MLSTGSKLYVGLTAVAVVGLVVYGIGALLLGLVALARGRQRMSGRDLGRVAAESSARALLIVRVVNALYESAQSGDPVKLNHFTDDKRPTKRQAGDYPPVQQEPELVAVENLVFEAAWKAAGHKAPPSFDGRPYERMADDPLRYEMQPDPSSKLYIPPPLIDELSEPFGNSVHQTRSGL